MLIIDDEELIGKCLSRVALLRGHKVEVAKDGEAGLVLWQQFQPHLVFLDILMPGMSGPTVLKRMGKKNNEKVVMMSAHRSFANGFLIPGVDLFVSKPFQDVVALFNQGESLCLSQPESILSV